MSSDRLSVSYNLNGIRKAVAEFRDWSRHQRVLCFSGGLGAGKTTFIHALCDHLGVSDPVSSPTFALINEYALPAVEGADRILHMDWYRLRDLDEAINAGMEDALDSPDALCIVEWPEQAPELLRMEHVAVKISMGDALYDRVLTAEIRRP